MMIEGRTEREVARSFGIHDCTVKKMYSNAAPPGYRRAKAAVRPSLPRSRISSTPSWRRTRPSTPSNATPSYAWSNGCVRRL
jgi:hypothetical protein